MPTTMKLIAKQTLTSTTATVTFSNIPGAYTDLLCVVSARANRTTATTSQPGYVQMNPNGSSANHSLRTLQGNGSTATSYTDTLIYAICPANSANWTADTFGYAEFYIPNYAGSTNKSVSIFGGSENNNATTFTAVTAALWSNTAAITSLDFVEQNSHSFVSGSSFFLYGITKA